MAVEDRRLHDAGGDHQPVILQNFAHFIDDTALFAHATFTIRQQRQHVERQLTAKEIVFIDRDTVQQLRALPASASTAFLPYAEAESRLVTLIRDRPPSSISGFSAVSSWLVRLLARR
jgi:hypothetical protein